MRETKEPSEAPEAKPNIRVLYKRYNENPEVKKLDRLRPEFEAWEREPTISNGRIVNQYYEAEKAVKPLRDPIDEINKQRHPDTLGIDRGQLESLVAQDQGVREAYTPLRLRLFDLERRTAPGGPGGLASAEKDVLSALERFNKAVAGKVPDYVVRDPQEVIAALRSELSPPAVKEVPQAPEDQVKARLEEFEAADAGKRLEFKKTKDLVDYLKSKGISEKDIRRWSTVKCWDEAAGLLGLERKKPSRPEPEGIKVLREQIEALQQEVAEMRQKLAKVDELEEKFAQAEADKAILLKALRGEGLSDEEKSKLAGLKGEAPPAPVPPEEADLKELLDKRKIGSPLTADQLFELLDKGKLNYGDLSDQEQGRIKIADKTRAEEIEKTYMEAEEEKKKGFIGRVGNFFKNWWKAVSPQGRNKWCWGFAFGVGIVEQFGLRSLLTPVIGPAGTWGLTAVEAAAINWANARAQKGITEAKANNDAEKLAELESRYKKFADAVAGYSAGRIASVVGDALYHGLVVPRLPKEAVAAPPTEVAPVTPIPEAPLPAEKLVEYVVKPGDKVGEILQRLGHDPYGPKLTETVIKNAELFASKGPEYARAVAQVQANPDWVAGGGSTEAWRTIMRAAHLIHPEDKLIIP